jgi:hypothetical protein
VETVVSDYQFRCYYNTVEVAEYATEAEARAHWEEHITATCPEGAMPWAKPIKWHRTPGLLDAAARREWLDHSIVTDEDSHQRHIDSHRRTIGAMTRRAEAQSMKEEMAGREKWRS